MLTAFTAKALPLPCISTAFMAKGGAASYCACRPEPAPAVETTPEEDAVKLLLAHHRMPTAAALAAPLAAAESAGLAAPLPPAVVPPTNIPGEAGGPFKVGERVVVKAGQPKATSSPTWTRMEIGQAPSPMELLAGEVAVVTDVHLDTDVHWDLYLEREAGGEDLGSSWDPKDLALGDQL